MKVIQVIFVVLSTVLLALAPVSAQAAKKLCSGVPCWGEGSRGHGRTSCFVEVVAPSIAGTTGLVVRDETGKSRWRAPRNKNVKAGWVTHRVGCGWFGEATEEVYMCVYGPGGVVQYYSRRTRAAGELADVLKTRRLEMCLLGPACPGYVSP
ncbi:MAG: hypothetical protein Q7S50_04240 [bacterium]|nr:hypothetical protein [bacterium]